MTTTHIYTQLLCIAIVYIVLFLYYNKLFTWYTLYHYCSNIILTVGHSSVQQSGMYPANTTQLDVDLVNPVMARGQISPRTFSQQTGPMRFYSPNTSNSAQMMGSMNTSQYPPGMMIRPQVQQQNQMTRMPIISNRMIPPLHMQTPQLGPIRYPSTFDNTNDTRIYNRLPNPGSSSVGQNLATVEAIGSNVNRPFPPPYNTSLTAGPYQHMAPMVRNPFYPSESDFSRYEAEQSNPTASQSISTVASSSVISSATLSHQQQVCICRYFYTLVHTHTHTHTHTVL